MGATLRRPYQIRSGRLTREPFVATVHVRYEADTGTGSAMGRMGQLYGVA